MDIFRLSTMVFTEQTGLEKLYGIVAYGLNSSRYVQKSILYFIFVKKIRFTRHSDHGNVKKVSMFHQLFFLRKMSFQIVAGG